jgi:thymidylate synthase
LKPVENTSTLFGPVVRAVRNGEKCSNTIKSVVERYSRILQEDGTPLYMCLNVHPPKQGEANAKSSGELEDFGKLGRALEYYEGKNDKGEPETINQITWASSKAESTPESRRIILTPNDPSRREYSINPIIIQFLIREETVSTVALYKDVKVEGVDRNFEELLAITREVIGRKKKLRVGPVVIILAPALF